MIYRAPRRTLPKMHWAYTLLLLMASISATWGQTIKGRIVEKSTHAPIPYANIILLGSAQPTGTSCNAEGYFVITLSKGSYKHKARLQISSLGYRTIEYQWEPRQGEQLGDIGLEEASDELEAVVVRPRRERYRRKNNPAVMLMERIIKAKESNRISAFADYSYQEYEKILISQIGTQPGKKYFGVKAEIADRYRDTARLVDAYTMPLSLREKQTVYAARHGSKLLPIITGRRLKGIEEAMDEGGATNGLDILLRDIDIYDNNIEMLLTEFPSPLNEYWATHFYKYYIQDTVSYRGAPCFLMHFRPMNPRSMGLSGQIWVDTLALSMRHVEMSLPMVSSVNWVERMEVGIEFAPMESPLGEVWLPHSQTLGIVLKPTGLMPAGLEVEVKRRYHSYRFGSDALRPEYRDPRSRLPEQERLEAMLIRPGSYGLVDRPEALTPKEYKAIAFVDYLRGRRSFGWVSSVGRMFATGFLPLPIKPLEKDRIKVDLGPYETILGYNDLEGLRLRLGGMTTANLMQHFFAEGYVTYGLRDQRWKYYTKLTYTPRRRNYHAEETPRHLLSLVAQQDLFIPGEERISMFKDGLASLLGNIDNRTRYYGDRLALIYTRDWTEELSTTLTAEYMRKTPTGDLNYYRLGEDLKAHRVDHIETGFVSLDTRWIVGGAGIRAVRQGTSLDFTRYRPSIEASIRLYPGGIWGNTSTYAHLSGDYRQRIHLSMWGRLDAELGGGMVLGDAPQTSLFHPRANTSWVLRGGSFQTLRPLEYMADRYLRFQGTYHPNGLLLSRIPLLRHLNLREVLSVQGYWGDLSARARRPRPGLEYLPEFVTPMNDHLHLEVSAGIENILNIFRVDYFYRLTDRKSPSAQRHVVRIQTKLSF